MTRLQLWKSSQTNAIQQLAALQGQLNEMKSGRQQDQRAWVFITIPDNALSFSGTNVFLTIIDKNVGKTPAIITSTFGWMAIDPKQIPPHDPIGSEADLMLIPNQSGNIVMKIPNTVAFGIFQNIKIYVYGTVFYRDVNQMNHWSQFCLSFDQNGTIMTPQNLHNSCDDLETDQKQ